MIRALALLLLLASCGSPLGALLGGGPKVAANVQAGAENAQTFGKSETVDQSITRSTVGTVHQSKDTSTVAAGKVEKVEVNQTPAWLILAFAAALFLDSPLRWPEEIAKALGRRRKPKAHQTR